MFEVGRNYTFVTNDHEGEASFGGKIIEVDLPLIKISYVGHYKIINTSSALFVSATPNDQASRDAEKAVAESFRGLFNVSFIDKDGNEATHTPGDAKNSDE